MKLSCASVYVIEPHKHEMLDFTLVPKLLGFFQWNYTRRLVLLRVILERGGGGEMVTGNQSKIGGGDGGKDLGWILAIKIVAGI